MIQFQHVALMLGGQDILVDVTWTIRPGKRIGLIGPNGAGKSTLLKVLSGSLPIDAGNLQMPSGTTIGYLSQDVHETSDTQTVLDEAMEAFDDVNKLHEEEHRLLEALEKEDHTSERYEKLLERLGKLHDQMAALDIERAKPTAEAILTGLGFDADELERPLKTFSGGWRMRAVLARMLLSKPDVLLLDEPTNHLDIDSIDWLETYLKQYVGTVVLVSHDRFFLDRMVDSIAELSRGKVTEYTGNYSRYLVDREARRTIQRSAFENQQREIAQSERFIERFKAKATKAKQAQSRMKQLEKLERIEAPEDELATIGFRFPDPPRSGKVVLTMTEFSKTYQGLEGPIRVFEHAPALSIERGDKVALIGKNGAGKSTLARMVLGTEPFEGSVELGHQVELTFFAQHQADALNPKHTILESLQEVSKGQTETRLRTLLGAFLFSGDDVFKPIGVLSGGERSRVALCKTLLSPANFLVLDEPTNHLDMASISVLVEALKAYTGTILVISHDRHFLSEIATRIWRAEQGTVLDYPGTYEEYSYTQAERLSAAEALKTTRSKPNLSAVPSGAHAEQSKGKQDAEASPATTAQASDNPYHALSVFKLKKEFERIEGEILKTETEKSTLADTLADPALYVDAEAAQQATRAFEACEQSLRFLYADWELLSEELTSRG